MHVQHFAVMFDGSLMLLGVVRLLEDCESVSRSFKVHIGVHCGDDDVLW